MIERREIEFSRICDYTDTDYDKCRSLIHVFRVSDGPGAWVAVMVSYAYPDRELVIGPHVDDQTKAIPELLERAEVTGYLLGDRPVTLSTPEQAAATAPAPAPVSRVEVGFEIDGYCYGMFGRDSYGPRVIVAIGFDWVVCKEDEHYVFAQTPGESIRAEIELFLRERGEGRMTLEADVTFEGDGTDFSAKQEADRYIKERGWSVGPSSRTHVRAVMFGDEWIIAKWHNLTPAEKAETHAYLVGPGRHGPLTLTLEQPGAAR